MPEEPSQSVLIASGMCLGDQRCQSIAEAQTKDEKESEDVVDEGSCCQIIGAVLADHHRVGKVHCNNSQLAQDNRGTYM